MEKEKQENNVNKEDKHINEIYATKLPKMLYFEHIGKIYGNFEMVYNIHVRDIKCTSVPLEVLLLGFKISNRRHNGTIE